MIGDDILSGEGGNGGEGWGDKLLEGLDCPNTTCSNVRRRLLQGGVLHTSCVSSPALHAFPSGRSPGCSAACQQPPPLPTPHHLPIPIPTPCSLSPQALGIPRVALLFLTKAKLPHEQTWRLWLEGAVGMLPHQRLPLAQVGGRAEGPLRSSCEQGRGKGWAC